MLWTICGCPVPVVGRIHGDCYAGGVGLAAVCDVLVAAEGVHFCLSEAKLGLLPATIGPYVVRAMGEQARAATSSRPSASAPHAAAQWASCTRSCRPNALDARWPRSSPPWWPTARRR
jgi:methylglutaconyl-CoA hydratase